LNLLTGRGKAFRDAVLLPQHIVQSWFVWVIVRKATPRSPRTCNIITTLRAVKRECIASLINAVVAVGVLCKIIEVFDVAFVLVVSIAVSVARSTSGPGHERNVAVNDNIRLFVIALEQTTQ